MKRDIVNRIFVDEAIERTTQATFNRLLEKGYGSFVSTHEVFGVLAEEWYELKKAMHENDVHQFHKELLDMAVGCIFGMACIEAFGIKEAKGKSNET